MPEVAPAGAGRSAPGVIVTRPERDARHWVVQLQQAGFAAEALPLIDIAPVCDAESRQALRQAWEGLADYAACMFVSGHAVEHFFKANPALAVRESAHTQQPEPMQAQQPGQAAETVQETQAAQADQAAQTKQAATAEHAAQTEQPAQPGPQTLAPRALQLPPGLRCMAPGPGTVAALLAAGVPAAQIDAPAPDAGQFDSEALWAVIGQRDWQGRRVLVVRGHSLGAPGASSGRDWITRQWQAAGAQVDFVGVYQRQAPQFNDAQLARARAASSDGSVWLFSSSEALAHLLSMAGLQGVDWGRARALATHPRIVQAVRAAGWGVVAESRPALHDIGATLGSLESAHP